MNDFFTWQVALAFALGVLLSAMVKGTVSTLKSKI